MLAELENNSLELFLTKEDIERLESGKPTQGRWNMSDKVYVQVMDMPPKDIDRESYEWMKKSKNKDGFAILNNETTEIDIFIPIWEARNTLMKRTNYSVGLQNLSFEPKKYYKDAMKAYGDFHISLNFTKKN